MYPVNIYMRIYTQMVIYYVPYWFYLTPTISTNLYYHYYLVWALLGHAFHGVPPYTHGQVLGLPVGQNQKQVDWV